MRVIGIDPGTICCGYGIVEVHGSRFTTHRDAGEPKKAEKLEYIASGEIRINKKDALPEKLKILYHSLKEIIDKYKPSHLCLEKVFFHKSIRAVLTLGSVRGIAMLLAAESAIPVFEYNSTELKQAITGFGRAEKRQVKEMVKIILEISPSRAKDMTEDSTDALALCVCHINSSNKLK